MCIHNLNACCQQPCHMYLAYVDVHDRTKQEMVGTKNFDQKQISKLRTPDMHMHSFWGVQVHLLSQQRLMVARYLCSFHFTYVRLCYELGLQFNFPPLPD